MNNLVQWLRSLAEKGGKGTVDNIDARALGRCADEMERLQELGEPKNYLIWSNEHRAWWRPNSCGYTSKLREAGHYSRNEAITISSRARDGWKEGEPPPEIPVRIVDAFESANWK